MLLLVVVFQQNRESDQKIGRMKGAFARDGFHLTAGQQSNNQMEVSVHGEETLQRRCKGVECVGGTGMEQC